MSNQVLEQSDKAQTQVENQEVKSSQANTANDNQVGAAQMNQIREQSSSCQAGDTGLPALTLGENKEAPGYMAVAREIANGAIDEVVNHPGRVLGNVAIGAAVGVGAVLIAPEVAIGAAVVGAGVAAYEVYQNASNWWNSAKTVADPTGKSEVEQKQAKETLHNFGGGMTDIVAGGVGGTGAAIGTAMIRNGISTAAGSFFDQTAGRVMSGIVGKELPPVTVNLVSPAEKAAIAITVTTGIDSASRQIQKW